jgi:hypothetical protein
MRFQSLSADADIPTVSVTPLARFVPVKHAMLNAMLSTLRFHGRRTL